MGFVFGIPGATIYSYRGLPIRESGKSRNVLVQHAIACLSCGFANGHLLDIQLGNSHLEDPTTLSQHL